MELLPPVWGYSPVCTKGQFLSPLLFALVLNQVGLASVFMRQAWQRSAVDCWFSANHFSWRCDRSSDRSFSTLLKFTCLHLRIALLIWKVRWSASQKGEIESVVVNLWIGIASFTIAFIFASFVEYWVHRLMHKSPRFGQRHRDHHKRNEGQGVLWEFWDYVKGTSVLLVLPFLISAPIGLGWCLGGLAYAAFSSYAHQLQHENPTKCFWMKMPVHYVHHKYNMWYENFGLGVDWWDHIFGTYKAVDWLDETELNQPERNYLQLRWR